MGRITYLIHLFKTFPITAKSNYQNYTMQSGTMEYIYIYTYIDAVMSIDSYIQVQTMDILVLASS